jgi:hypothetical protein
VGKGFGFHVCYRAGVSGIGMEWNLGCVGKLAWIQSFSNLTDKPELKKCSDVVSSRDFEHLSELNSGRKAT